MAEGTIGGTAISDLPASSFAYCEPGDGAVSTRCHFPIRDKDGKADAPHVRNALARLSGSPFEAKARPKVEAAAKELNIGEPAATKAFAEVKAEPMDETTLAQWLSGQRSRRILVVPFGGPVPSKASPLGVDIDGEWFDDATDIYGPFAGLKANRERLVDWHHTAFSKLHRDPAEDMPGIPNMKGAVLGRVIMDAEPSEEIVDDIPYAGVWGDLWANLGEKRRALIRTLAERNAPLYGSSQAVPGSTRKADTGHIDLWPVYRHTLSTSPQNTHAVVPSLKAMLTDPDVSLDDVGLAALKAALVGLDELIPILGATRSGDGPAAAEVQGKAGRVLSARNEAALRRALGELSDLLSLLDTSDETPAVAATI